MPFPGTVQSGGNRIDVTTLTPFNNDVIGAPTTAGAFVTILSITGKGYLDSAYIFNTNAVLYQIRVTVDGVVTVLLGNSLGQKNIGVASKNDLYASATAGNLGVKGAGTTAAINNGITALKPYPTIDGSDAMIILGDAYIYFYKSLLIEYSIAGSGTNYRYSGAYKS